METKVVKWERGEMEKGQRWERKMRGKKDEAMPSEAKRGKAKQKEGMESEVNRQKSRGAVTRQVPSNGF